MRDFLKKKLCGITLLAVVLMSGAAVLMSGCSRTEEKKETSEVKQEKPVEKSYVIKVAHAASESNPGHKALEMFNDSIQRKTDGRIKIEIFPNAQLGSERELIEGIQLGNVDMCFVSSAPVASFQKEFFALDMPFLFSDREMVYRVLDGPVGQGMLANLEKINIKGLGFWENGFRNFSNSKVPVRTPEDLAGIKIRTMENEIHLEAWKALGANPAPLAFGELFTALQQKTFDAQETPINLFYEMKYYEVQKYITKTNHLYSPFVLMMNLDLFNSFSPADRQAILDSIEEAKNFERNMSRQKDIDAEKAMEGAITFIELTPEEKAAFKSKMGPVYEKVKAKAGEEIVNKVIAAATAE
jgi:tripartite ATP-independent transporter DctP family solute receptor